MKHVKTRWFVLVGVFAVLLFAGVAGAAPKHTAICPGFHSTGARVSCLVKAVKWERRTRHAQVARIYKTSVDTAFQIAQIVYGMPRSEATRVGTCESHLNPLERNSVTATGVMQELDSTFNRTPFSRVRVPGFKIASFDPVVNILAAGFIWHQDGGSWREWDCRYAA